ncbi:MAG TPA: alkaline phosphatase family protein [Nitrolancea sp.]
MRNASRLLAAIALVIILIAGAAPAVSAPIAGSAFQNVWARTDQPVASGAVQRTWLWGPEANTPALSEPYAESPNGSRTVQYFDKSRMELTNPGGDPTSPWYVTNGLLAKEMITGKMQVGDNAFETYQPATVNVAGDQNDTSGPTYATFSGLLNQPPHGNGYVVAEQLLRSGQVVTNLDYANKYQVTLATQVTETNHSVAAPFWAFMTSSGTIWDGKNNVQGALFQNAFYATGFPITEPYWTTVKVGGVSKDVLIQVFQRRVLTYTPSNPAGWQVESGNVGQHYYQWRYTQLGKTPVPADGSQPPAASTVPSFDHIYVIMMENKEYPSIVGDGSAPYINQLIQQYGSATNYTGVAHPSQPNYIALWSGSTGGITDDANHDITGTTIADQLEAAGMNWMVYAENYPVSTGAPSCYTDATATDGPDGTGTYARKHNPAMSFTSVNENAQRCAQHITDFSHFDPATAGLNLIVPNLCHDMHDCPVSDGDSWLQNWLPAHILNTPTWNQTNSAVIITWDEGTSGTGGGGHIPTIIISKQTPAGYASTTPANHYTLLRTIEDAFGLGCLQASCTNGNLAQFFGGRP